MVAAAWSPCPTTSPTTRPTRVPDSGITSNQSPPTPVTSSAGEIAVGGLDGGLRRQVMGQQLPLEGEGGGALAGVAARVVDADGGPGRQLVGQGDLAVVERGRAVGAERPARGVGALAPVEGDEPQDAAPARNGTTRVPSSSTSPPEDRLRLCGDPGG